MEDPVKYCEENYSETITEFKKLQEEMYILFCKKQMDYGIENITLGKDISKPQNKTLSLTGVWFRMNDKMQRIINLINNKAYNESIEDSWIDLANYSLISLLISKNKWFK